MRDVQISNFVHLCSLIEEEMSSLPRGLYVLIGGPEEVSGVPCSRRNSDCHHGVVHGPRNVGD